jgi:YebC/PmpR family DNA-binding regulatory protein
MAGHSKFKNIMHKKGRADSVRSKLFSKLSRDITVAAKSGIPDPAMNPRLRLAVNNAKAESMPKDNIDRAIKKGVAGDADTLEDIRYEGFGPAGIGIIVEALTDNRNRTGGNVRSYFTKCGGNLGESNSVAFMWNRLGQIEYPLKAGSPDTVMEAAIEAGAEDVEVELDEDMMAEGGGIHLIYTTYEDLNTVAEAMTKVLGDPKSTRFIWKPQTLMPISGDQAKTLMKLLDSLNDDDDVQNVYANFDMSDEDMALLQA